MPLTSQESERSCICVWEVSILHLSTILIFHLELFRQCFSIWSIQIKSIPINLKRYIIFTIIVNVFPNCLSLKIPYLHINLAKQIVDWHAETLLRPVKSTSYKLYYRYKETSLRHRKVAFNYKYGFCHLMTWHLSVASSNRYNDKVIYKIWLNKIMFSRVLNAK